MLMSKIIGGLAEWDFEIFHKLQEIWANRPKKRDGGRGRRPPNYPPKFLRGEKYVYGYTTWPSGRLEGRYWLKT